MEAGKRRKRQQISYNRHSGTRPREALLANLPLEVNLQLRVSHWWALSREIILLIWVWLLWQQVEDVLNKNTKAGTWESPFSIKQKERPGPEAVEKRGGRINRLQWLIKWWGWGLSESTSLGWLLGLWIWPLVVLIETENKRKGETGEET